MGRFAPPVPSDLSKKEKTLFYFRQRILSVFPILCYGAPCAPRFFRHVLNVQITLWIDYGPQLSVSKIRSILLYIYIQTKRLCEYKDKSLNCNKVYIMNNIHILSIIKNMYIEMNCFFFLFNFLD